MPGKKYPFQNKSVNNIRNEVWKDIPGFEGIYQASNFGRIKSLDRTILHARLGQQFVGGRILSQSIAKNLNIKTGEPMVDLRVSLSLDGIQHYFSTRRLIYMTFVNKKINYLKDGLYVINKNGDGYDNKIRNLQLVTKSEKQKRVFTRDRQDSYLKIADRSKWPKTYGSYTRHKPAKQYLTKRILISAARSGVKKAAEETMEVMGYVVIAQKGWIVRKFPNGAIERMGRIASAENTNIVLD